MATFDGVFGAMAAADVTFRYAQQHDMNNSTKLFAERGGVDVGVIYVSMWSQGRADGAWELPHAAWLQYLYVPPEARGTGVAMALLKEAKRWAREKKPQLRYLLASARWEGSDKLMHAAYGAHIISAGSKLDKKMPKADWNGVRDGPSIEYVFVAAPKSEILDIAGNPPSMQRIIDDFMRSTEYVRGGARMTVRKQ